MSGIAGWIDRERDLRTEGLAASQLVAALVARGRHGEGLWLSPRAILGQRTDAVWVGTAQPAVIEQNGRAMVAAVCDGYLHNADDLWAAAGAGPSAGGPPSVAEVVLHAYLRWGHEAVERLEGNFAFAVWDARTDELLLGRDRVGIKPLSYALLPHGVVFASEVAALAAHPLVTPEVDDNGLCALVTQLRSPGRGALRGMYEVPAGGTVRFTRDRELHRRYWTLEARPHTLGREDTIKQIRELLVDAISRDLRGLDPAVLLSGGLDSSALTGLIASNSGKPPRTFTVMFGDTAAAVPDRPFAEEVVQMWGCEHHEVAVRPQELSDPVLLSSVLAAKDHPSPFGDKNITPFIFSRRVAERVPVVLSGEAADAIFSGLSGATDGVREPSMFPWIARARGFGMEYGIGTGLFDEALLRSVDVAGYLDRLYREAKAEVPQLAGTAAADRVAREVDYLHVTRLLEQTVYHSERLGAAAGLQIRFPIADHRLVSYLYNVPWQLKRFDGREKSLLRAIAKDLVPPSVLTRAKVPYPITYDAHYKASLITRLRMLLDDSTAPVRPLIDLRRAAEVIENHRLLDRGGWLGRADVEMVLQLDNWLRRLRVRVNL
ncbi:asparagine synthetase B [Cystobacter fuscus]|uniref:asparagine synthase (glutamine-hydrolyzing) n=1 Tax=Cystobacter fuscus TaxID=43 RepID=A0A250J8A0_9BACT|nr:asparagine synthetase B [Cystobacter fuscus]